MFSIRNRHRRDSFCISSPVSECWKSMACSKKIQKIEFKRYQNPCGRVKKGLVPDAGRMIILVAGVTNEHFGTISHRLSSSSLLRRRSPAGDANLALVTLPSRSHSWAYRKPNA